MTPRLLPLHPDRGITIDHGEGVYVWDTAGRRYLDAMSNYGVNILGHRHPTVDKAVREQLERISNVHVSFGSTTREGFLEALGGVLPEALSAVTFSNSGSEAVEAAFKFARLATGRIGVVAMEAGYHGRTMGALTLTGNERYRAPFAPLVPGVRRVPFDDIAALEAELDDGVAAVIVEPIQGEAGIHIPGEGYLPAVRRLCDRHGALLIADEVQTALRTGSALVCAEAHALPDIICLSKSIANGVPLGVTAMSEAVAATIPRGAHGSTFAGNPLAMAAGTATLRAFAEGDLHADARRIGGYLMAALRETEGVAEVRGRGLMIAIDTEPPAMSVVQTMQRRGLLALATGEHTIRFLPPVILTDEDADEIVRVTESSLRSVLSRRAKAPSPSGS